MKTSRWKILTDLLQIFWNDLKAQSWQNRRLIPMLLSRSTFLELIGALLGIMHGPFLYITRRVPSDISQGVYLICLTYFKRSIQIGNQWRTTEEFYYKMELLFLDSNGAIFVFVWQRIAIQCFWNTIKDRISINWGG